MISLDRNQILKAALELPHEEQEALIVAIQERSFLNAGFDRLLLIPESMS